MRSIPACFKGDPACPPFHFIFLYVQRINLSLLFLAILYLQVVERFAFVRQDEINSLIRFYLIRKEDDELCLMFLLPQLQWPQFEKGMHFRNETLLEFLMLMLRQKPDGIMITKNVPYWKMGYFLLYYSMRWKMMQ